MYCSVLACTLVVVLALSQAQAYLEADRKPWSPSEMAALRALIEHSYEDYPMQSKEGMSGGYADQSNVVGDEGLKTEKRGTLYDLIKKLTRNSGGRLRGLGRSRPVLMRFGAGRK